MAENKVTDNKTVVPNEKVDGVGKNTKAIREAEPVYSVDEFAQESRKIFGNNIGSECVVAAFRLSGKTEATVDEAKSLVNTFMKKEVL